MFDTGRQADEKAFPRLLKVSSTLKAFYIGFYGERLTASLVLLNQLNRTQFATLPQFVFDNFQARLLSSLQKTAGPDKLSATMGARVDLRNPGL
jgi:hypothetical protein